MKKWKKAFFLFLVMAVCTVFVSAAFADGTSGSDGRASGWYMGEAVNAGHDTGFPKTTKSQMKILTLVGRLDDFM